MNSNTISPAPRMRWKRCTARSRWWSTAWPPSRNDMRGEGRIRDLTAAQAAPQTRGPHRRRSRRRCRQRRPCGNAYGGKPAPTAAPPAPPQPAAHAAAPHGRSIPICRPISRSSPAQVCRRCAPTRPRALPPRKPPSAALGRPPRPAANPVSSPPPAAPPRRAAARAGQRASPPASRRAGPAEPEDSTRAEPLASARLMKRVKSLFIAASIIAIVVGSAQIAGNVLDLGGMTAKTGKAGSRAPPAQGRRRRRSTSPPRNSRRRGCAAPPSPRPSAPAHVATTPEFNFDPGAKERPSLFNPPDLSRRPSGANERRHRIDPGAQPRARQPCAGAQTAAACHRRAAACAAPPPPATPAAAYEVGPCASPKAAACR